MSVPLFDIRLSVVVTVYSETFSVKETVERLLRHDRGHIQEIFLVLSPLSSKESFSVCRELEKTYPLCRIHIQEHPKGVGWAYREGMALARGNYIALMSGDLETEQ